MDIPPYNSINGHPSLVVVPMDITPYSSSTDGSWTSLPRHDLALKDKYEVVLFQQNNIQSERKDIANFFSIAESTVTKLISNTAKIKKNFEESNIRPSAKRLRRGSFSEVDPALLKWFTQMHTTRPAFPISGAILLSKANDFAEMYGYGRPRWIDRWKVHHDISFKPFHGEASL